MSRVSRHRYAMTGGGLDDEWVERVAARVIAVLMGGEAPFPVTTALQVRRLIAARRLRDRYFGPTLFADPAWDMLLDLYAAGLEGAQVPVSSLCIAAACPPTTALRWLTRLFDSGLVERNPDPFDKRRTYMRLTSDARARMQAYFKALG